MTETNAIPPDVLDEYAAQVDRLSAEIIAQKGNLEPAYNALDTAIEAIESQGLTLESILPADNEFSLGFAAAGDRTGKGVWDQYKKFVKKRICSHRSRYQKIVAGGSAGTGSLLSLLLKHLGLPNEAIFFAVTVGGIIGAAGLDTFCIDEQSAAGRPSAKKQAAKKQAAKKQAVKKQAAKKQAAKKQPARKQARKNPANARADAPSGS